MNKPFPLRRQQALISQDGLTYLRWQNPFIVAWWSAAFPGFGHFLLHQFVRGILFSLWEVAVNTMAHINEALVYSLHGKYELAKDVLEPQWLIAYLTLYLFAIWDSYCKAVVANQQYHLAEMEGSRLTPFIIRPLSISYISMKRPLAACFCSFIFPGLGELYNNRIILGFYGMFWWMFYGIFSHAHESLLALIQGHFGEANLMLKPHWLLFMPSVIGGSIYDAYMTADDHNRLFRIEQTQYFSERYPHSHLDLFTKVE
jgi:TM2 domain-containing membrane protein YozV